MVGHWSKTNQLNHETIQFLPARLMMSAQKRSVGLEEQCEVAEGTRKAAKRSVSVKTVDKWKADNDKALSTSLWLQYDKVNGDSVTTETCSLCITFNERL